MSNSRLWRQRTYYWQLRFPSKVRPQRYSIEVFKAPSSALLFIADALRSLFVEDLWCLVANRQQQECTTWAVPINSRYQLSLWYQPKKLLYIKTQTSRSLLCSSTSALTVVHTATQQAAPRQVLTIILCLSIITWCSCSKENWSEYVSSLACWCQIDIGMTFKTEISVSYQKWNYSIGTVLYLLIPPLLFKSYQLEINDRVFTLKASDYLFLDKNVLCKWSCRQIFNSTNEFHSEKIKNITFRLPSCKRSWRAADEHSLRGADVMWPLTSVEMIAEEPATRRRVCVLISLR